MSRAEPLLSPRLLGQLEQLQLSTRRPLAGLFSGEHRSSRYGTSLDFADYREYHAGDDYRRIDYHLYARLDVLLLKLFEAEDDLTVRIVIDTSASMGTGDKLLQAQRLAAALAFVGLIRRDTITVHTFPLDRPAPRFIGRGAVGPLFNHIESLEADGTTNFAAAVSDLLSRSGPPGATVVFSDLLTPEWAHGLSRLPARGGDVGIVHVLGRDELDPEYIGDLELIDAETKERVAVSLSADALEQYRSGALAWADDVAARARRAGATYARVMDDDDVERLLVSSWREEGILR